MSKNKTSEISLLKEKYTAIDREIETIKCDNDSIYPITDGIINIEEYANAKFKILWILKESNDVSDGIESTQWSLTEAINELNKWEDQPKTGRITFQRMIYASYGILNNFIHWKNIPNINEVVVFKTIKQIAYINVKKCPGGVQANNLLIQRAYEKHKDLLLRQIEAYNPDIVIAGNTLKYFLNDLSLTDLHKKHFNDSYNTVYYPLPNRLYIHSWHPAVRSKTISEEEYCNEIIMAAKDWIENYKIE